MHFYAWTKGLKTGMYYLRTRPKADAIKFTVDVEQLAADTKKQVQLRDKENVIVASSPPSQMHVKGLTTVDDDEGCLNCGA